MAIEIVSFPIKMVIFDSYVSLLEGSSHAAILSGWWDVTWVYCTVPHYRELPHPKLRSNWRLFIIGCVYHSGWWGLEHDFYFPIQLGMSSSQLTKSYFSEGFSQPPTSIRRKSHESRGIAAHESRSLSDQVSPYGWFMCQRARKQWQTKTGSFQTHFQNCGGSYTLWDLNW